MINAAAEHWGAPAASLTTADSKVFDREHSRSVTYGDLTSIAADLPPPENVRLKNADEFRLIGQNLPRLDGASKSDGTATFGMDLQLPDMLYASIAHCPVFGGKLDSYDASAAERMSGVRKVVVIPTGVAVIAETFWQAKRARENRTPCSSPVRQRRLVQAL